MRATSSALAYETDAEFAPFFAIFSQTPRDDA
jgi:hypothetical protein